MTFKSPDRIRSVLITGGSGFVGGHLTTLLLSQGYKVSHLSGSKRHIPGVSVFEWDPGKGIIDKDALKGIDCIVHLAGANLGEGRWTKKRKREIVESRVISAQLLFKTVTDQKIKLETFISASAIGYYGTVTNDKVYTEEDPPATGFLGNTCNLWEKAADLFADSGIRTVKIRTGIVLAREAGSFMRLYKPARYGFVIRLGCGYQYMPWIHITDLCNIYLKAIEDTTTSGSYNAVAPEHINHDRFIRTMADLMNRTIFLPRVPSFLLRIILGEMGNLVLKGSPVSSGKISEEGYSFVYSDLKTALKDILY